MKRRSDFGRTLASILCTGAFCVLCTADLEAQQKKPTPKATSQSLSHAPRRTSIDVTVVEIAGTQAYLRPGASGGLHRGAKVTLNGRIYTVGQTTASFAVIEVGHDPPHELDTGRASVVAAEADKVVELPKPRPLSTWQHAWTDQPEPASLQTPRLVPLGSGAARDRRWDIRLTAAGGVLAPLGQRGATLGRAELDVRIHAEPFMAPVAFDLDLSLQSWFAVDLAARAGAQARSPVYVRELLASYADHGYFGSLGRMRYASSTLGTLDGARVAAPLGGGFSIGAFGGVLPDPNSGAFSAEAQRFGVEARYARPEAPLRPEAALVVHGSTFQSRIDERRVSGVFGLYPGTSRLSGYFEGSAFDADNPWRAKPLELTAAGLDGSLRAGVVQLSGHFDWRTPERSRWLGAALPLSWFCRTVPTAPGALSAPDTCDGRSNARIYGSVDASVMLERASLVMGASTVSDLADAGAHTAGAFVSGRVLKVGSVGRFEASGSFSRGTYLNSLGGSVGLGVALFSEALDVSVYYRHSVLEYRSDPTSMVQRGAGGTLMIVPSSEILLTLQGEAMTGSDTRALAMFGTIAWHPMLR